MIDMVLRFDTNTIRLITLFENLTGAPVKDCLEDKESNSIYFIIEEGNLGVAIGKNGHSVKKAERIIGKTIRLFEFSKNITVFVKNMIPQSTDVKVKNKGSKIIVEVKVDKADKAVVIGRDGRNKTFYENLLKRNHQVDELIVR